MAENRFAKYRSAVPAQPVTLGTPDPFKVAAEGREDTRLRIDVDRANRDAATAQFDYMKAQAEAEKAQAEADKAAQASEQDKKIGELRQRDANLQALANQIVVTRRSYDQSLRGGLPNWLQGRIPSSRVDAFNRLADTLVDTGQSAFRIPGSGDQSDREMEVKLNAIRPSAIATDLGNDVNFDYLKTRVDTERKALGLDPIDWDKLGATLNPPPAVGQSNRPDLSGIPDRNGGATTIAPPNATQQSRVAFPGLNKRVTDIIRGGGSLQDVVSAMSEAGNRPSPAALDAIQKNIDAVQGGYNGPLSVDVEREMVPLSSWQAAVNPLAQTPIGTAAITAGDAVTGFNLARLMPNANQTRAGIAGLSALNPKAALAGNLAGGVAAGMGGEAGLGLAGLGRGAGALAPRLLASDAAYGGLSGYGLGGENADIADVAGGALLGAGAGAATRGVIGGIAGTVGPTGGAAAPLYREGVRPTLGQRFANSGMLGRAVNTAEQALQSVPLVGSMVAGARQGARDQFERGAFNAALGDIGKSLPANLGLGNDAHRFMQSAFDDAYDKARSGMRFVPDAQYQADRAAFEARIGNGILSADEARRVRAILDNAVTSRLKVGRGSLSGDAYKAAASDISKAARSLSAKDAPIAAALRDYAGIFDAAARRASAPDAVALMDRADSGYAKAVRIEDAAASRGGDTGRFSPTQFDRSVQRASGGVRSRAYLRGDALMGDYAEAGKLLVDTLPNSGTADRLMTGQAVGGSALSGLGWLTGGMGIPAGAVAATIPYAPGIRRATTGLLAPTENPIRLRIAEDLLRNQSAIGLLGAPLAFEASR